MIGMKLRARLRLHREFRHLNQRCEKAFWIILRLFFGIFNVSYLRVGESITFKPMRTIYQLIVILLGIATAPARLAAHTETELKEAGLAALHSFQKSITTSPAKHGFKNAGEIEELKLSPPIPLSLINREALAKEGPASELDHLLHAPQTWYFIAKLHGEARAIVSITVLRGTQTLAPEAFGKQVLARSLDLFLTKYSAKELLLVAGRNPLDTYVHIRSEKRPNLSPLTGDLETSAAFVKHPADAEPVLASLAAE